jgi:hypothetical protein
MGSALPTYDSTTPSCGAGCAPVVTQTPSYESTPYTSQPIPQDNIAPRTFKDDSQPAGSPESRMRPTPDIKTEQPDAQTEAPRLIDPVARNQARPIHQATYVKPITRPAVSPVSSSTVPAKRSIDVSGWRASHD